MFKELNYPPSYFKEDAHKKICKNCLELKETGLTNNLFKIWKDLPDRISSIERSVRTLNPDFDETLLLDDVCFECSLETHCVEGIVVVEHDYGPIIKDKE